MNAQATSTPDLETLVAATFFLMSRYHLERRGDLAEAIAQHLGMLLEQPRVRDSRALSAACRALVVAWRELPEQAAASPTPAKRPQGIKPH